MNDKLQQLNSDQLNKENKTANVKKSNQLDLSRKIEI